MDNMNAFLEASRYVDYDADSIQEKAVTLFSQSDEYMIDGVFAVPEPQTMALLTSARTIEEVWRGLPDTLTIEKDA